jgi:hypothetical protein
MKSRTEATWWQRLLYGFGALVFTLLLAMALVLLANFVRYPKLHLWDGGVIQSFGYLLLFGGGIALVTFLLFVCPLVLLWPAESQRRHWYGMMCAAIIWPPLVNWIIFRPHPHFVQDIRREVGLYGELELVAICSCGCYLLLLRWQHSRLKTKVIGMETNR